MYAHQFCFVFPLTGKLKLPLKQPIENIKKLCETIFCSPTHPPTPVPSLRGVYRSVPLGWQADRGDPAQYSPLLKLHQKYFLSFQIASKIFLSFKLHQKYFWVFKLHSKYSRVFKLHAKYSWVFKLYLKYFLSLQITHKIFPESSNCTQNISRVFKLHLNMLNLK